MIMLVAQDLKSEVLDIRNVDTAVMQEQAGIINNPSGSLDAWKIIFLKKIQEIF
jgi:hypothetical protein